MAGTQTMAERTTPIRYDRSNSRWETQFAGTIEREIIPRLLAVSTDRSSPQTMADRAMILAVAEAAVAGEAAVVQSHVETQALRGKSIGDAMLDLLGPAARSLGEDWVNDRRDFMDVTIGLGTLQQVVHTLSGDPEDDVAFARRILLAPTPGEAHTFGLAVVDHLFRHARWDVCYAPFATREDLVDMVGTEHFSLAGLSIGGETLIAETKRTIAELRCASINPDLRIIVGGPAVELCANLCEAVGADAVTVDGRQAVALANSWVALNVGAEAGR
ncbi:MAG: cobalamin B12-binding domain-containing protein [Devosia sp.]